MADIRQSFSCRFRKPSHSCTEGMYPLLCTSNQCSGTSLNMISITRPSSVLVLQATNIGVRKPGYKANVNHSCTTSVQRDGRVKFVFGMLVIQLCSVLLVHFRYHFV